MNLSAYDNLLTLLRNAINGESRVLPSLADWPQLMAQARIHGVEPLAYDAALRLPADQQPDKQLAVQMKQVCLYQMQQQQIWLPRIRKAVEALRSAGVEPVLLKGFGLADLYPKPCLRSWGDADIWVGVSNYHAGCKAVREAFPEAIHHDQEYEELKHYSIVFPDGNPIELHRVSMDFPTPDEDSYSGSACHVVRSRRRWAKLHRWAYSYSARADEYTVCVPACVGTFLRNGYAAQAGVGYGNAGQTRLSDAAYRGKARVRCVPEQALGVLPPEGSLATGGIYGELCDRRADASGG